MAESLKVLGQIVPSANTLTTLYTVPGGKSAVVSKLTICNLNTVTANAIVKVAPGGAADDPKHTIEQNILLLPGFPAAEVLAGFALGAGDVVRAQANMANVAFSATGSEVS